MKDVKGVVGTGSAITAIVIGQLEPAATMLDDEFCGRDLYFAATTPTPELRGQRREVISSSPTLIVVDPLPAAPQEGDTFVIR